jgi:hypothetical protein
VHSLPREVLRKRDSHRTSTKIRPTRSNKVSPRNLQTTLINTITEVTEDLLGACRNVGLEINAEKAKCVIMSRRQNSGQNQNIRIANEIV